MTKNPFDVLGVSKDASEAELKSAYRKLARKYHPDINPDSKSAEEKMSEINDAYNLALKIKRGEATWPPNQYSSGSDSNQGYSGGWSYQSNPFYGAWSPFGFGGAWSQQTGSSSYQRYADPQLQAASDYLATGRVSEALSMLDRIPQSYRDAQWYGLAARANSAAGNRIAALNYARQAVSLDPNNIEYRRILNQLEQPSRSYQQTGSAYGFGSQLCSNPCLTCCAANLICNLCCGGTWCCI